MAIWLELKRHYTGEPVLVNMNEVKYFESRFGNDGSHIYLAKDEYIEVRDTYDEIHQRLKGAAK